MALKGKDKFIENIVSSGVDSTTEENVSGKQDDLPESRNISDPILFINNLTQSLNKPTCVDDL